MCSYVLITPLGLETCNRQIDLDSCVCMCVLQIVLWFIFLDRALCRPEWTETLCGSGTQTQDFVGLQTRQAFCQLSHRRNGRLCSRPGMDTVTTPASLKQPRHCHPGWATPSLASIVGTCPFGFWAAQSSWQLSSFPFSAGLFSIIESEDNFWASYSLHAGFLLYNLCVWNYKSGNIHA